MLLSLRARAALAGPGLCGMAATLVGVGIGRFAYAAILPLLVQQAWFDLTEAGHLGAANLTGYLLGIGIAAVLARRCTAGNMVRAAMLLCALSLLACSWRDGDLPWFLFWRTVAGICGAILMVQAPVLILPGTPAERRGRVGGVIFSGVGLGIVAAATIVPSLANHDLTLTWLALSVVCALLTALTWRHWPAVPIPAAAPAAATGRPRLSMPVMLLCLAYTLNAIGYLPHTLFWADYITRELHRPLAMAAFFWACFGAGAACGPYLTGMIADRFGLTRTLAVAFALKAFGVALPLFAEGTVALLVSSVLVGFFSPGIVGAASGFALEIGGARHHRRNWTAMNLCFSLAQAGGASAMVWIMAGRQSYALLFVISAVALAVSVLCILAIALLRQRAGTLATSGFETA
ncbi:YbfB/YjiJ family MFS transporter [Massilia consociata]|uniref:YbfB/YjiJ family MFS transporter n=1 Tax=Massilia consociata TaxID=760117 RepID=A0ABV6FMT9_9BURK